MKRYSQLKYTDKIKWRIRTLRLVVAIMLIYMVVVGEIGGGDSRIITDFAGTVGRIIFFGGFIYIILRIYRNKKLLKNRLLLKEQLQNEQDERNQYLHDKSGGIVWDILFICSLFITLTASLFNMSAFYTSIVWLVIMLLLKTMTYFIYSRI